MDLGRWKKLAEQVLLAEGVEHMEVSVSFVDEATIAELAREHLGSDGSATDVLSFPIDDPAAEPEDPAVPQLLGDVVVCPQIAERQAPTHAGSVDDELALLIVHGLLHLLGMDHEGERDTKAMQARERELLARFHGPVAGDPWQVTEPTTGHNGKCGFGDRAR